MSDVVEQKALSTAMQTALEVLKASTPVLSALTGIVIDSTKATEKLHEIGSLSELDEEAKKQAIALNMAKMQAVVAQELAIAERIREAEEVEIEEYYEGEGSAGLQGSASMDGASIALGGGSKRVTKRVFKFSGRKDVPSETGG